MPDAKLPTSVLSDRLSQALRGRRVRAAVFTTFSFEPGFFEEDVLPLLFEQTFSHVPNVRVLQLEEVLPGAQPIAVYYDRGGLVPGTNPPRLDVRRIGISRPTGCFHPKIVAALVEETRPKTEEKATSLVLAVLSANLTRAGWWENVECAEVMEITEGERCSFRGDLRRLLRSVRTQAHPAETHEALEAIDDFLLRQLQEEPRTSVAGTLSPRLFVGQKAFASFASELLALPPGVFHLEVISPYLDGTRDPVTLTTLIEAMQPKSTVVCLPRDENGAALCTEELFEAVRHLPGVRWGELPRDLTRRSASGEDSQIARFTHAKVYRLWSKSEGREYVIAGSVNLSRPAHSASSSGNLEAAIVIETPKASPRAWLQRLPEDFAPPSFGELRDEGELAEVKPPPVTIVYAWDTGRARYFWEGAPDAAPGVAVLSSAGVELGRIDPVVRGVEVALPVDLAQRLRERLPGTSYVGISVNGGDVATLLVLEEGMSHKPSVREQLTAAEILRYWALLSAEQRQAFLDERMGELLAAQGITLPGAEKLAASSSLFDGFAGIFHAFARLEEHVSTAIQAKRPREAEYRLFGRRFDSLFSLIDKVMAEESADPVIPYVTLLAAQQLLRHLRTRDAEHEAFFADNAVHAAALAGRLECIAEVRARFDFDDARQQFFTWFDRRFLEDARRPSEAS